MNGGSMSIWKILLLFVLFIIIFGNAASKRDLNENPYLQQQFYSSQVID